MDKRKIRTILLVVLTTAIFSLSYYICVTKLKNVNTKNNKYQVNEDKENYDSVKVHSNVDNTVDKNAKIVFKIKYIKSGEIQREKEEDARELAGKKKSEVEQIYKDKGYKVDTITPSEVVLIKEADKYAPNKYVLGIKDGLIAIYKTDKEGNMFIENEGRDVTDIKTDRLKDTDIKLLTNGDKYFQCNTREDAEARLEDYE